MIIVDTDVIIEIFDKKSEKGDIALKKIESCKEDIAITSINLHEVLYGHYKRNKKINDILQMDVIEFNKKDAELSSRLEIQLEKKGLMAPRIDTMIAAIAINRKAKLFTFNKKHFQMFDDLLLL